MKEREQIALSGAWTLYAYPDEDAGQCFVASSPAAPEKERRVGNRTWEVHYEI